MALPVYWPPQTVLANAGKFSQEDICAVFRDRRLSAALSRCLFAVDELQSRYFVIAV